MDKRIIISLNPCFNGRYSQRRTLRFLRTLPQSLNPCFNGRYSQSIGRKLVKRVHNLSLNPCFNGRYSQRQEDGTYKEGESSLNPCFNGRYSQRAKTYVSLYTSIWGMFKLLETLLLT